MENICLDCALCCDGTIHSHAALGGANPPAALAATGVHLVKADGKTAFRLPCPAVRAGCCSIYDARPAICREASCALRRRYDAGDVSFDAARVLIAQAKELRDRIRPELDGLFDTPGPHAIADLFPRLKSTPAGSASSLGAKRENAELLVDLAALRHLLIRHFEPPVRNLHGPGEPDSRA